MCIQSEIMQTFERCLYTEYHRAKIPGSPAANQAQLLLSKMQNLSEIPCVLSGEFISKFDHIKLANCYS